VALSVPEVDRMKPGEVIQTQEANVMAVVGISFAGIAQPNYELHRRRAYRNLVSGYYG
jgi:hypothetical protein